MLGHTVLKFENLVYFIGILLLGLITLGTCYSPSSAETAKPTSSLELHFNGTDATMTEPFTIEDGWEITWETESKLFQLSAYGVTEVGYGGTMTEQERIIRSFEAFQPIILANSSDSTGKAFHRLGGTFYLKIVATGPWTIHLKAVKRTKDYLDVPYTGAP